MMYRNYKPDSKIYGGLNKGYFTYQFLEIDFENGLKPHKWKVLYDLPQQSGLMLLTSKNWTQIPNYWLKGIENGNIKYIEK